LSMVEGVVVGVEEWLSMMAMVVGVEEERTF
jgi:hypothetical protein